MTMGFETRFFLVPLLIPDTLGSPDALAQQKDSTKCLFHTKRNVYTYLLLGCCIAGLCSTAGGAVTPFLILAALGGWLTTPTASAQLFGSGPSDPALFDQVISLPGDSTFEDEIFGSIGNENGGGSPTTQLNVADGGTVASSFQANSGSEVNITGGIVSIGFSATSGSEVNISGGNVDMLFSAFPGSEVNISGGTVGSRFEARSGSQVNLSGGTVGDGFQAFSGSEVNLFGTEFFLDGMLLDELIVGEAFTITDRDVTLSGLLADGSAFSFDLNLSSVFGEDYFDTGSTLTVTQVPEPSTAAGLITALTLLLGKPHRR